MIFFADNDGTVINSYPSPVYQGSADVNNIYLIAPFAVNLNVAVAFRLPNGVYTERYLMTQAAEITGAINKETGKPYAGWQFSLPNEITQYYGTVTAQFYFYSGAGKVVASSATSFTVGRGVPEILPDEPSADIYDQILENLSVLSQDIKNLTLFVGVFTSAEALKSAYHTAVLHSYAYIAGGNIWTYEESGWTDSGKPSPDEVPPKSTALPLMDGEADIGNSNTYADGLHRHPTDFKVIKNLYNLGAYDSASDNGDGSVTVTRQTGYLKITNADIRTRNGYPSGGGLAWYDCENIHLPTQDITSNLYSSAANSWTSTIPNLAVQSNGNIRIYSDKINLQEFREWLAENPVYVQYKLSAPYTEKVIASQPIHTLDQSGEQWLREERDKGLNLAKPVLASVTTSLNLKVMAVAKTTPGERYSWSGSYTKSGNNVIAGFGGIYILPSSGPDINGTYPDNYNNKYGDSYEQLSQSWMASFTATDEYALIVVGTTGVTANFTVSDLMVQKGGGAYPYERYNGGIVREKEVPLFITATNENPAELIGGDWEDKGTVTTGNGTVLHVYRRL